jgi:hypothetical protein
MVVVPFLERLRNTYAAMDRTPFYLEVAKLENELRGVLGTEHKIKMTIAEMIACEAPRV